MVQAGKSIIVHIVADYSGLTSRLLFRELTYICFLIADKLPPKSGQLGWLRGLKGVIKDL